MSHAHHHSTAPLSVEQIFADLAPAVITWANLRLPPVARPHVTPEDLAQEVWLRALRIHHRSFDVERMTPRKWLFAVAKHVLLEVQRSIARRGLEQTANGSTSECRRLTEVPAATTNFTQLLVRTESVQRFLARVAMLSEDDRRLLVHRGFEELPLPQVAAMLGIDTEAATKRWQRLRAEIRMWPVAADLVVG